MSAEGGPSVSLVKGVLPGRLAEARLAAGREGWIPVLLPAKAARPPSGAGGPTAAPGPASADDTAGPVPAAGNAASGCPGLPPGLALSETTTTDILPALPRLALVGAMAAGKTTVGRLLARALGLPFEDSDSAVEAAAGLGVGGIFAAEGEAGFRARETAAMGELAHRSGGLVLATGGGVVLSPVNRGILESGFIVIWLYADPEELCARLRGETRALRPLLSCEDPEARLFGICEERMPLYAAVADLLVPTGGLSPEDLAAALAAVLGGATPEGVR